MSPYFYANLSLSLEDIWLKHISALSLCCSRTNTEWIGSLYNIAAAGRTAQNSTFSKKRSHIMCLVWFYISWSNLYKIGRLYLIAAIEYIVGNQF